MVKIGNNSFKNVAFPLVFGNRYFMLELGNSTDIWTVFTIKDGEAIIEILKNTPQNNSVSEVNTNATGIVTVSEPDGGKFLYKLRPGKKSSSIFGNINGTEKEIKITDKEIIIGTNKFQKSSIENSEVGIRVSKNGDFGIGGTLPQELRNFKL
jgi:hypothetical protein